MTAMTGTVLEHEIGPTGLLAIRLHASGLRVRAVDGPVVRIADRSGNLEHSLRIERAPGSLSLRADRGISIGIGSLGVDVGRRTPDLDVEVPRGATVVLETASGDLTVDGLAGDQRYRTASGTIQLGEVSGALTVDAVSGDVSITTEGDCTLAARTVSGDLSVRAGTIGSLRISTTSGDMRIEGRLTGPGRFAIESVSGDTILAPIGGVIVAVKSVTGDIRSDLASTSEGTRGSRTVTVGDGGVHLTLRSISGDLRLVRPSGRAVPITAAADSVAIAIPPRRPVEATERIADPTLAVLEALERGAIDVAEASRRLADLDGVGRS